MEPSHVQKNRGHESPDFTGVDQGFLLRAECKQCGVRATEMARASRDTTFTMYALSHYGLSLGGAGRYADAAEIFDEVRRFGRKYGVLQLLARATAMTGGLHLSVFDFEGAEALACEARELGRSAGFLPSVVSAGIDLLLMYARQHDPGRADGLLSETSTAAVGAAGSHGWLWQLRLCQVRAELALAHDAHDHDVFHIILLTAFMGYAAALWQMAIWYNRSIGTTIRSTIDGLIYALITAAVFTHLWPR